jgi:hypothetical protein
MNWKDSPERLEEFYKFLNSLYQPIKWTKEIEVQGTPFNIFDIKIIRDHHHIQTTVYRKPTASDRYLHFTSAQAWREKTAAIHSLTHRALKYCSTPDLLQAELDHLRSTFQQNGFPLETINKIIEMKQQP